MCQEPMNIFTLLDIYLYVYILLTYNIDLIASRFAGQLLLEVTPRRDLMMYISFI